MSGPTGPTSLQTKAQTETVAQIFQRLGLPLWWTNLTNPFNGVAEKGEDFSAGYGAPIGAIASGNVVYVIHHNNSINDEVGVSGPVGLIHYQHINAKVHVGDSVNIGDVVGTQNGLPVDQYSTGTHIEVRYSPVYKAGADTWTGQPWTNPAAIFTKLVGYTPSQQTSSSIATHSSAVSPQASQCDTPIVGGLLCWLQNSLPAIGIRIGLFVLALVLVILGGIILIHPDPANLIPGVAAVKSL